MPVEINAIIAMSENRVIGLNNSLPWHISEDLKRFSALTTGHTVLMGRKTYQSLPDKYRPLPNRKNVVLSRSQNLKLDEGVQVINNLAEYLHQFKKEKHLDSSHQLWVIGGAEVFKLALDYLDRIFLTLVNGSFEGDAFLPPFESEFKLESSVNRDNYSFLDYVRA